MVLLKFHSIVKLVAKSELTEKLRSLFFQNSEPISFYLYFFGLFDIYNDEYLWLQIIMVFIY